MLLYNTSIRNKLCALLFFGLAYKFGAAGNFQDISLTFAIVAALPGVFLFLTSRRAYIDFDDKQLRESKGLFFAKKRKSVDLDAFTRVKLWRREVLNVNSHATRNEVVYAVILVGPREHHEIEQSASRVKMENLAHEIGAKLGLEVEESGVDADGAADLIRGAQSFAHDVDIWT